MQELSVLLNCYKILKEKCTVIKIFIFVFVFLMLLSSGCSTPNNINANENNSDKNIFDTYENNEVVSPETDVEKQAENNVPIVNGWTPNFKPSDFETMEEYEKAFLDEYAKHLEPIEYFETEKEYPAVILEIFDLIMAEETVEFLKCEELRKIEVSGDENEFFVSYLYLGKKGSTEGLNIRIRKVEDGKYELLGRGGGPLGYGLEKMDITLEDILNEN